MVCTVFFFLETVGVGTAVRGKLFVPGLVTVVVICIKTPHWIPDRACFEAGQLELLVGEAGKAKLGTANLAEP